MPKFPLDRFALVHASRVSVLQVGQRLSSEQHSTLGSTSRSERDFQIQGLIAAVSSVSLQGLEKARSSTYFPLPSKYVGLAPDVKLLLTSERNTLARPYPRWQFQEVVGSRDATGSILLDSDCGDTD